MEREGQKEVSYCIQWQPFGGEGGEEGGIILYTVATIRWRGRGRREHHTVYSGNHSVEREGQKEVSYCIQWQPFGGEEGQKEASYCIQWQPFGGEGGAEGGIILYTVATTLGHP